MPWLSWELLFSMFCMRCTDKGSSLNLDLMNIGNDHNIITNVHKIKVKRTSFIRAAHAQH